jgi:hypothetical protein
MECWSLLFWEGLCLCGFVGYCDELMILCADRTRSRGDQPGLYKFWGGDVVKRSFRDVG